MQKLINYWLLICFCAGCARNQNAVEMVPPPIEREGLTDKIMIGAVGYCGDMNLRSSWFVTVIPTGKIVITENGDVTELDATAIELSELARLIDLLRQAPRDYRGDKLLLDEPLYLVRVFDGAGDGAKAQYLYRSSSLAAPMSDSGAAAFASVWRHVLRMSRFTETAMKYCPSSLRARVLAE